MSTFAPRMPRAACVVSVSLLLTGCASWISPQPPDPPTAAQIRSQLNELNKLEHGAPLGNGDVSAVDVASAGYDLVDTSCSEFFSDVYKWSNDTGLNRKEITLAGAGAAGVLAALKASAQTIAITAIATSFVAESLDNFQNFALFTPKPNAVGKLVSDAMATYRRSAPPSDSTIMTDVPTAKSYVSGYADLCTYHRIQDFVEQAVAAATTVDKNGGQTSIFSDQDRVMLSGINAALGLPPALLSDAQYEELYWFLISGYTNTANRTKVLNDFSTISGNLWDAAHNTLPPGAVTAANLFASLAKSNPSLVSAEKAIEAQNKPAVGPPGAPAFPVGRVIIPATPGIGPRLPDIRVKSGG